MGMITDTPLLRENVQQFVADLCAGLGRTESRDALGADGYIRLYAVGLVLNGERKSVLPMATRVARDPKDAGALRQRMQQAVGFSPWSDDVFRGRLALKVERGLPNIAATVFDDTGFEKKGRHSPGVARQYSGTLGRIGNCQVAVSAHLAGEMTSACVAMRLYLPEEWANDRARCREVGIPDDVTFQTKPEIALSLLDDLARWGVKKHPVLADSAYGRVTEFREGVRRRGYHYVLEIPSDTVVWRDGEEPLPAPPTPLPTGRVGRPAKWKRQPGKTAVSVKHLAMGLGRNACHRVKWRDGTKGEMESTFCRARVRHAHQHQQGRAPGPEEWLLWEWPPGEPEPVKYYLAHLPAHMCTLRATVCLARMRWRVERDYQDMKGEVGLNHYEGRTWIGFHHHATMCMAAHAFLALHQSLFPPEGRGKARGTVDALGSAPGDAGSAPALHRPLSLLQPPLSALAGTATAATAARSAHRRAGAVGM